MSLKQPELVAIYRRLRPNASYLGDPPERWAGAVLTRQIRVALAEDAAAAVIPYPEPGSTIPPERNAGVSGYVVGACSHRMAASEWAAGFTTCEACDPDDYADPPEMDPEDAEAQRIAETYTQAADEYRAIEAGEW